jgi:ribulose-5-phosphate 4-epimerase/fuculose-1-phosphate aldolase
MKDKIKELIKVGKRIVNEKLVVDTGGNISFRYENTIFIKSKGYPLNSSSKKSYALMDFQKEKSIKGTPSSEKYIHLACYKKRPDIDTVFHLHPVFSTAVANSSIKIEAVSYELCATLGSKLAKAKYRPSGSKTLAKEVEKLIAKHNAILMPNHGIVVVGRGLQKTLRRALAVERACKTLIYSKILGVSRFLPKKEALRIIKLYKKA